MTTIRSKPFYIVSKETAPAKVVPSRGSTSGGGSAPLPRPPAGSPTPGPASGPPLAGGFAGITRFRPIAVPSSDVPSDPPKGDVPARDVIAAVFKGLIKAVRPGIEEAFELVRSSAGSRHADQFAYRLGDLLKEMQLLKIRFPGTPEKIEKG